MRQELFEIVPFNIAVIDKDFNVILANKNFEDYFGDWRNKKCHEVYKSLDKPCEHCKSVQVFEDGKVRVSDETGVDRHGKVRHYVVHIAPIKNARGEVEYVVEMSSDLTETRRWQRHYNLLFERVPCYITVIDDNFQIIRANEKFRETFGEVSGQYCFEVYKKRKTPCLNCPAAKTFEDGLEHSGAQKGITKTGDPAYYMVHTSPLSRGEDGVAHVIEIATDITQLRELEGELRLTRDLSKSLIKNSDTGIIATDVYNYPRIMNPAAKEILGLDEDQLIDDEQLADLMPREYRNLVESNFEGQNLFETIIHSQKDEDVPVEFRAVKLSSEERNIGTAFFLNDLRELKKLEKEKLDNERLAAVGQTVAGLAHTIKNLLMGLEGGMYMVDSGLTKGNAARVIQGWDVLQRNFNKTTDLVKDFLAFAKGRMPQLQLIDPNVIVKNIVELYVETAKRQGVTLKADTDGAIEPAPLDPEGIEACLTNLVSNGIDAAMWDESDQGEVCIKTLEDDGELVFEVVDNGTGMEREVKQKVFTTFFTTKGGKGTGLGLLTTRKIVQEHGGSMEVESEEGKGSTFRIRLPRSRLNALMHQLESEKKS